MIPNNEFFMLYTNCIPVKGAKRSIICDLQLNKYRFVPNLLVDILKDSRHFTVADLKKKFGNSYDEGIDHFFSALAAEGWGFFTSIPEQFQEMDMQWHFPGVISNAIIDMGETLRIDFGDIVSQLSELGCEGLQVRFFETTTISFLEELAATVHRSNIQYCEYFVKDSGALSQEEVTRLMQKYKKTRLFCLHSSKQEKIAEIKDSNSIIIYTKDNVISSDCCGVIHKNYFQPNIRFFTESLKFNSCLNKKIAIDIEGFIRNCPSMPVTYGHASEVRLESVISENFSTYWFINKDQIDTCKDCEFRYICSDCRAFTKDPGNMHSKPLKCSYDPYEAVWKEDVAITSSQTV